jgi:hypothetical protein
MEIFRLAKTSLEAPAAVGGPALVQNTPPEVQEFCYLPPPDVNGISPVGTDCCTRDAHPICPPVQIIAGVTTSIRKLSLGTFDKANGI